MSDSAFAGGERDALEYLIRVLVATVCGDETHAQRFAEKLVEVSSGVPPVTGVGPGSLIANVLDSVDRIPSRKEQAAGFAQILKHASWAMDQDGTEGGKAARDIVEKMIEFLEKGEEPQPAATSKA